MAQAEEHLRQTEITQPAVLSVDNALTQLLADRGLRPDFVMGHSLGEYAALVAAGALPFEDALEAVSARGREMADLEVEDPGLMAAVFAPLGEIENVVEAIHGNVVVANINSTGQAVIGGATAAVKQAEKALTSRRSHCRTAPREHGLSHVDRGPRVRTAEAELAPVALRASDRSPSWRTSAATSTRWVRT